MRQQQALQQAQQNSKGQVTQHHNSQHSGSNNYNPSVPQGFVTEKQRPINPSFVGNYPSKPSGIHSGSLGQVSERRSGQGSSLNTQHFGGQINHSNKW